MMSSTHHSALVLVALLASPALVHPAPALAQHFPTDAEIVDIIRVRIEEGRAVGMVIGVMEADGSTRIVAFGEAGPGARPLGPMSVFEIGSISKVFTGTILADMVARGEVSLSDPVQNYLPERASMPTRAGREITLVDLSTHHSALPRLPDNMAPADTSNPYADYTFDLMYAFLSGHELRRDIRSEFEYSNLAVGLLGHALARAADTDYEGLVEDRIFDPLGMAMSTITLSGDTEPWMVRGHDAQGNVTSLWDIPAMAGAGAIRSNMDDMLVFLAANTGPPESDLEHSMRASHEVRETMAEGMEIGLNWITRGVGDDRIVWHNGGTGGFRTFMGFDPDRGVGVVVLTNSGHGADDIGFHLINPRSRLPGLRHRLPSGRKSRSLKPFSRPTSAPTSSRRSS